MAQLIVKGGTVLGGGDLVRCDVVADGGRIVALEERAAGSADRVIDAAGTYVIPGVIDSHVHFREAPAAACAEDGVYETFVSAPALPFTGSAGAPPGLVVVRLASKASAAITGEDVNVTAGAVMY